MSRWFFFLVAIAFGVVLGLLYGWVLSPVEFVDTTPDTLGRYYKSDYVLMVAEAYKAERDLGTASLTALLKQPAGRYRPGGNLVRKPGLQRSDVNLMRALSSPPIRASPGTPAHEKQARAVAPLTGLVIGVVFGLLYAWRSTQ
jgi:hypothetical protein